MNLYIKNLIVEEDEKITVNRSFDDGLTVITGEKCSLMKDVIKSILGYQTPLAYPYTVCFFAEVKTEETFFIRGSNKQDPTSFQLQVYKKSGEECAEEYYNELHRCSEEQSVNCFSDFKRQKYPHRLFKYKDLEQYYPNGDFPKLTDGFGTTRSFRAFTNQYIKDFQPIQLNKAKPFWLHLVPSGRFEVKNSDGSQISGLSASESILYHYLCFICLASFWSTAENIRNFNHVNKPIIVSDFIECLDQSIDISDVLRRTSEINRQSFLFTPISL